MKFPCGCEIHKFAIAEPSQPFILYCPMHEAALVMFNTLRILEHNLQASDFIDAWFRDRALGYIRAAIKHATRENTPTLGA